MMTINPCFGKTKFNISIENFFKEFEINAIAAEDKFKNKKIKLTGGIIDSIDDPITSDIDPIVSNSIVSVKIFPKNRKKIKDSIECIHPRTEYIVQILRKGMEVDIYGTLFKESTGFSFTDCSYKNKKLEIESRNFFEKGKKLLDSAERYAGDEKFEKAVKYFSLAITYDPDFSEAYFYRANALTYDDTGVYSEEKDKLIVDNYTKAIEIKPDFKEAYLLRGEVYAGGTLNKFSEAINDFKQAIKLQDKYNYRFHLFNGSKKRPSNNEISAYILQIEKGCLPWHPDWEDNKCMY